MSSSQSKSLVHAGMRYERKANVIICCDCATAVDIDFATFESHCMSKHQPCNSDEVREKHGILTSNMFPLKADHLSYTSVEKQLATWKPLAPIEGIPVVQGLKCPQCNTVCGNSQTMRRHQREKDHKSKDPPKRIPAQALWKLRKKRFFYPVFPEFPRSEVERNELVDMLDVQLPNDSADIREMSDFVARNGSVEKLRKLGISPEVAAQLCSPVILKDDVLTPRCRKSCQ